MSDPEKLLPCTTRPSSCPVCRMTNSRRGVKSETFTMMMRNLDDPHRIEFQCWFCHSIFWWNPQTEEACGLESYYPLTRAGWDEDIKHIRRVYEKGETCPRCNADPNFRETDFNGAGGKCVICRGTGVYPGDD